MPFLLCTHLDKRSEWTVVVTADSFTMGFSEDATVPLPDRGLSAKEVVITRDGEHYHLTDLAERDRVRLNGTTTREAILKDGDGLQLGRILVRFLEEVPKEDGQVVLQFRKAAGAAALSRAGSLEFPLSQGLDAEHDPAQLPGQLGWAPPVGFIAAALVLGIVLGYLGAGGRPIPTEPPASAGLPAIGSETRLKSKDSAGASAAPAPTALATTAAESAQKGPAPSSDRASQGALAPLSEGDPLSKLRKLLQQTAGARGRGDDPLAARRRLHRLFLDVASRPPTRAEESALLSLGPEDLWSRVLACAESRPEWADSPRGAFRALLGREPTDGETKELEKAAAPERPPAFWASLSDAYAAADRRRPRSGRQRAAALLVDLLDVPPSSSGEVEMVRAALESAGGGDAVRAVDAPGTGRADPSGSASAADARHAVARALVHSERSRLPKGETTVEWWEDDLFRFLLRAPTEKEKAEIPTLLKALPEGRRRSWFLLALSSHPDYESY